MIRWEKLLEDYYSRRDSFVAQSESGCRNGKLKTGAYRLGGRESLQCKTELAETWPALTSFCLTPLLFFAWESKQGIILDVIIITIHENGKLDSEIISYFILIPSKVKRLKK